MNIYLHPMVSLIAGVIVLVYPKILNYVVGLYFIIIGVLGFLNK